MEKIPADVASLENMPSEAPLKYDELCRIVGALYLDSYRRLSDMEKHYIARLEDFGKQYEQLRVQYKELEQKYEQSTTPA